MFTSATSSKVLQFFAQVGLVFMICACTSSKDLEHPEDGPDVPDEWQADRSLPEPVQDGWLGDLGMPALMPLVAEALRANADLQATAARFERAGWEAAIEEGAGAPSLDLSLGAERNRSSQIGSDGQRDAAYTSDLSLTLDVTWEIDVWGRIRANAAAADADAEAARHDYHAARLSLAAQTAEQLVDLTAARLQQKLAKKRVLSFKGTVERVTRRYQRGLTSAFDLHLAESDLANAEADLAARADQLAGSARALEVLIGRYPAGDITGLDDLPSVLAEVPVGLPATLLERRPDMAAERARIFAAGYRTKASKAELLPRISLTVSGGTRSEQFSNLFDPDFLIATVAGNLVQPIFQGGRLRGQVAANQALETEALANYVKRALDAFKEVEDSLGTEYWLARREEAQSLALDRAAAAERLAEVQYERGLIPILELLTAQRSRLDAEEALLDVRRQRVNSRITLHLALGGDFAKSPSRQEDQAGGLRS